jgi:uncharacterized membrane protein required for colicin V production
MIYYILGILTGLISSLFFVVIALRYTSNIQRVIKTTQSKLSPKGAILEPHVDEIQEWVKELENNAE